MAKTYKDFEHWADEEVETGITRQNNITASLGPWSEKRERFIRSQLQQAFLAGQRSAIADARRKLTAAARALEY